MENLLPFSCMWSDFYIDYLDSFFSFLPTKIDFQDVDWINHIWESVTDFFPFR